MYSAGLSYPPTNGVWLKNRYFWRFLGGKLACTLLFSLGPFRNRWLHPYLFKPSEKNFQYLWKIVLENIFYVCFAKLQQLETRQSKGASGCFFRLFFRKQAAFFSFKVVEKRSTRHLKAEILYFSKIKIWGHVEYSTPPNWGLNSTCGPKKAPFHGAKNAKYGSWAKKSIFSKSEILIPQSNHGKRNSKTMLVRP